MAQTVCALAAYYTGVIWSSLLNASPPGEILRHWLGVLAPAPETTLPEDKDEFLLLLMQCLRRHRYLLVLDNTESILCSTSEHDNRVTQPLLNRHALLKAGTTDSVRQSQVRLILHPVASGWSEDGRIATVATADCVVHHFEVEAGRRLTQVTGPSSPIWRICFSADGQLVACASTPCTAMPMQLPGWLLPRGVDCTACLWDARSSELIHRLEGHTSEVATLGFALNGAILATASHDCSVRLWDVERGCTLHVLRRHTQPVRLLTVTPEGNLLATNRRDMLICLWDVQSGEVCHLLATWPTPTTDFLSLAVHPAGEMMAAGAEDQMIYLLDLRSRQVRSVLPGHSDVVNSVKFSRDGWFLLSTSADETVKLRQLDAEAGRSLSCQTLSPPGPYAGMKIAGVTGIRCLFHLPVPQFDSS